MRKGHGARAKLIDALGQAYAAKLTVADLRVLVLNAEMQETQRLRQTEPAAIVQAIQTLGEMGLKKAAAAQLCEETGKRCER